MSTELSNEIPQTPVMKSDPREKKREALIAGLPGFTGTEQYYQHPFLLLTDGAKFVAEVAGAFWLMDVIGSYQPKLRRQVSAFSGAPGIPFQVWKLKVDLEQSSGVVTCQEDSDAPELVRQEIPYTDFPMGEFTLFVQIGSPEKPVVMVPGEN